MPKRASFSCRRDPAVSMIDLPRQTGHIGTLRTLNPHHPWRPQSATTKGLTMDTTTAAKGPRITTVWGWGG